MQVLIYIAVLVPIISKKEEREHFCAPFSFIRGKRSTANNFYEL